MDDATEAATREATLKRKFDEHRIPELYDPPQPLPAEGVSACTKRHNRLQHRLARHLEHAAHQQLAMATLAEPEPQAERERQHAERERQRLSHIRLECCRELGSDAARAIFDALCDASQEAIALMHPRTGRAELGLIDSSAASNGAWSYVPPPGDETAGARALRWSVMTKDAAQARQAVSVSAECRAKLGSDAARAIFDALGDGSKVALCALPAPMRTVELSFIDASAIANGAWSYVPSSSAAAGWATLTLREPFLTRCATPRRRPSL